jgi:hypothetical protein
VALALACAGCRDQGPKTYPVTGKVSHQGKPLPFGAVMFVPEDGPGASAKIEEDGSYKADLVPGTHRIAVVAVPPPQGRPDPDAEGGLDMTGFTQPKPLVPEKYSQYDRSGVQIEVQESAENIINIELP